MPEFEAPSNYKDQVKIDTYIDAQKKKYLEDAAFNAMTGKIVAIGILPVTDTGENGPETIIASIAPGAEEIMVNTLIQTMRGEPFIGWYLNQFAIPFIFRRSWKLWSESHQPGVDHLANRADLAEVWAAGEKGCHPKLDDVAGFLLGVPVPIMKDVHTLLVDGKEQDVVLEISRELTILRQLSDKMGVIDAPRVKTECCQEQTLCVMADGHTAHRVDKIRENLEMGDESEEFIELPERCALAGEEVEVIAAIRKDIGEFEAEPYSKPIKGIRVKRVAIDKECNPDGALIWVRLYF